MKSYFGILVLFSLFFSFAGTKTANAAYLSRPELVDFNFGNAAICERSSLRLKFDYENFTPNSTLFTVEISQNNFAPGSIIQMIGTLTPTNNSQQNVFFTVNFPTITSFSGTYQLRVKGTNPETYSQLVNEYPFTIIKFQPADPNLIPSTYWRGNFYKWTPSTNGVISDANSEDIFNPNNYLGNISELSLNFDYNWGANTPAPSSLGAFPDSNKVCGSYKDAFSIRMRRKINFEDGYYRFTVGGDDGVRLSIDSGQTWLVGSWRDQIFKKDSTAGTCGYKMQAGPKVVVVEFYDHNVEARFFVEIKKSPTPSPAFSGLQPSMCSTSGTVNLIPQTQNGAFSGTGVSGPTFNTNQPNGIYTVKHVVIASNGCIDSSKVQVQIVNPITPVLTIPSSICKGSNPVKLLANVRGIFSGPGVVDSTFTPANANIGQNTINFSSVQGPCTANASGTINVFNKTVVSINLSSTELCFQQSKKISASFSPAGGTLSGPGLVGDSISANGLSAGDYTIQYIGGTGACADTVKKVFTIYPLPDAGFKKLPDSICVGSPNINLEPNLPGGRFEGQGLTQDRTQFSPQGLIIDNQYYVDYKITDSKGCKNETRDYIYIKSPEKPTITFPQSKTRFCTYDATFIPISIPAGKFYLNGLEVLEIFPSTLKPGDYALKSIYTPLPNNRRCEDSASAWFRFSIIDNPKPDLGPDFELEKGFALNVKPNIPAPYTWKVDPSFGDFVESSKPITLVPKENVELTVTAYDTSNTCYGSDAVKVTLRDAPFFPNLFTPNGDGDNDVWEIKNGYADMEVSIYNRWGKEVYTGKTKGEVAWSGDEAKEPGLYFFAITKPDDGRKWNGWLMVSK
jgi:gliding motility-associated-like protein